MPPHRLRSVTGIGIDVSSRPLSEAPAIVGGSGTAGDAGPEGSDDMAEVVLSHHAQGLTSGVRDFAATLERAGHTVHLPDLFEGQTFDSIDAGVGYAQQVGFDTLDQRAVHAIEGLPAELVY